METRTTDLQRIARIFNLKTDEFLALKIQDIMKSKESDLKKKEFSNSVLWSKVKKYESEIHNLKNEFAESIGIHEYMMIKKSRDNMRKELNKALEINHKLNETIRSYQEQEFKDRLMKIEGVR